VNLRKDHYRNAAPLLCVKTGRTEISRQPKLNAHTQKKSGTPPWSGPRYKGPGKCEPAAGKACPRKRASSGRSATAGVGVPGRAVNLAPRANAVGRYAGGRARRQEGASVLKNLTSGEGYLSRDLMARARVSRWPVLFKRPPVSSPGCGNSTEQRGIPTKPSMV